MSRRQGKLRRRLVSKFVNLDPLGQAGGRPVGDSESVGWRGYGMFVEV